MPRHPRPAAADVPDPDAPAADAPVENADTQPGEETTDANADLGDTPDVVQPGEAGPTVEVARVELPMPVRRLYPEPAEGVIGHPAIAAFGRHVAHDPRSKAYPIDVPDGTPIRTVEWQRHIGPLNQGQLGSCTGNAIVGLLMTDPFYEPSRGLLDEATAVALYSKATHLDREKGVYPPTDTGSSGLAVCKAAKEAGYISEYRHGFGVHHLKLALQQGAVIVGSEWTEGMFTPDADGVIVPTGAVVGGHEYEVLGWNETTRFFKMVNSWGDWGPLRGYALISEESMGKLLAAQGDVTQPTIPVVL